MIVKGMVTRCLIVTIHRDVTPLFHLHSTVLFRWLQHLELTSFPGHEIPFLPWLEQIKTLEITRVMIPEYSLNIDLPLAQTLQRLDLDGSSSYWMLGRSFKALRELQMFWRLFVPDNMSGHEGLQIDLPVCTVLHMHGYASSTLRFLSCSNVQSFRCSYFPERTTFDLTALNSLRDFIFNLSCLQELSIYISPVSGLDSLIRVIFCGAREQGVWRDIRSVEINVRRGGSPERYHIFDRTVGNQHFYETWWKEFTVTNNGGIMTIRASV